MRILPVLCLLALPVYSWSALSSQAEALYQVTEYQASLRILNVETSPDAATFALMGKNHFMLGDYRRATEFFERALALNPRSSEFELWLGRAYGKRAETGAWLLAPANASKARQHFEKAAALDAHNAEALNDLFDYYLNAPGFLGGGLDRAEAVAQQIAASRPAEYHFELAQIAEHRKQYAAAEDHLRRAMALAPGQVGRMLDLARYLAKLGRVAESDAVFAQASQLSPNDPRVAFARAKTYIDQRRNIEQAQKLLHQYLESRLTPDDPPKSAAEKLLHQAAGG
ncbi:MAG TPA: tetratricopeptide repeat protein [Bryobacteraceae bacterium]|nr:tetratricopeptide repeat protein [Bryobacteraceae bacterium]